MNNNKRIEYIDALKGFAIFIVIWGHSLLNLKNGYDFFHNPVFEFIYSFHMPLFFMLSGFFFRSSLKLNMKEFFFKKSIQLLWPWIVWGLIAFFVWFFIRLVAMKMYLYFSGYEYFNQGFNYRSKMAFCYGLRSRTVWQTSLVI